MYARKDAIVIESIIVSSKTLTYLLAFFLVMQIRLSIFNLNYKLFDWQLEILAYSIASCYGLFPF